MSKKLCVLQMVQQLMEVLGGDVSLEAAEQLLTRSRHVLATAVNLYYDGPGALAAGTLSIATF